MAAIGGRSEQAGTPGDSFPVRGPERRTEAEMTRRMPWILVVALLAAGCIPGETRELQRCQADLDLKDILDAVGVPRQPDAWGVVGQMAGRPQQPFFDREYRTALVLPDPEGFVSAVCAELRVRLESRCAVPEFETGPYHCHAVTHSRSDDTTDETGNHFRLASAGRVNLHAYPRADGTTHLYLSGMEADGARTYWGTTGPRRVDSPR